MKNDSINKFNTMPEGARRKTGNPEFYEVGSVRFDHAHGAAGIVTHAVMNENPELARAVDIQVAEELKAKNSANQAIKFVVDVDPQITQNDDTKFETQSFAQTPVIDQDAAQLDELAHEEPAYDQAAHHEAAMQMVRDSHAANNILADDTDQSSIDQNRYREFLSAHPRVEATVEPYVAPQQRSQNEYELMG